MMSTLMTKAGLALAREEAKKIKEQLFEDLENDQAAKIVLSDFFSDAETYWENEADEDDSDDTPRVVCPPVR